MWSRVGLLSLVMGTLKNSDLEVKTIEQSEPNWTLPIETFGTFAGLTADIAFARIQKLNQELEIVISVSYTNATEDEKAAYTTAPIAIELPEDIAKKIFDCNGNDLTIDGNGTYIASVSAWASRGKTTDMSKATGAPRLFLVNGSDANKIEILFASATQMRAYAGETLIIEARIQLALI